MRKLFLMTLALCSLTLFSCKNDNGQQNGDNNAKDNNTEATAQAGNAFELANFSITLPDGWKDTYKSDGNLNAANEVAVALFMEGKIGFLDIGKIAMESIESIPEIPDFTLNDIFEADKDSRQKVLNIYGK